MFIYRRAEQLLKSTKLYKFNANTEWRGRKADRRSREVGGLGGEGAGTEKAAKFIHAISSSFKKFWNDEGQCLRGIRHWGDDKSIWKRKPTKWK